LYQCLTGRLPFQADSVPRLTAAILSAEPTAFGAAEGVPKRLSEIVLRCVKKDPIARFQTVEELERALSEFSERASAVPERLAPSRLRIVLSVAAGVVALILAGGFAFARWGSPSPQTKALPESSGAHEAAPSRAPEERDSVRLPSSERDPAEPTPHAASEPVIQPALPPAATQPASQRKSRVVPRAAAPGVSAVPAPSAKPDAAPLPSASAFPPMVKERLYRH
jgi:serine/threonine-protein kinase